MLPATQGPCEDCRFWQRVADEDEAELGICRRRPPDYAGWPMTLPSDWCGEFVPAGR